MVLINSFFTPVKENIIAPMTIRLSSGLNIIGIPLNIFSTSLKYLEY